ncbi:MAG TPA: GntR family transcriptional regulator [Bryobacteraceae bacterium]|jgi:GntR family transcriptional regulator|nr:GntR family transcriptional regulator [Bryobacteraceae bacterium]
MTLLNKDLPMPLYHQLKCILMESIDSGQWQAGQQLPNESKLAENFGVSKITVRQALQELADLGYVRREQGRGTFVSKPKLGQGPRELSSFTEEMRRHQLAPASLVLEQSEIRAEGRVAEALELAAGAPVLQLKRLRLADGEPMGVQTAYIALELAAGLQNEHFEGVSLYDLLRTRYGLHPARARETHLAVVAEPATAALLGIAPGSAVFEAERVTFLADGRPFELVKSIMRGDRYSIVLDLAVDQNPQTTRQGSTRPWSEPER